MQVHEQPSIGSGRRQQVSDQLGRDGDARTVFSVLPRIAVVRHNHGDAPG